MAHHILVRTKRGFIHHLDSTYLVIPMEVLLNIPGMLLFSFGNIKRIKYEVNKC